MKLYIFFQFVPSRLEFTTVMMRKGSLLPYIYWWCTQYVMTRARSLTWKALSQAEKQNAIAFSAERYARSLQTSSLIANRMSS